MVSRVSADVTTDPTTGMSDDVARIRVPEDQTQRLGAARLLPGMPVERVMRLGDRSVLSDLAKPLSDQIAKAWREG